MRLYEILLRARVTGLFTGAYRVYFKGRCGVLDVVSTGALAGTGETVWNESSPKSSFTVVDVEEGAMKIFAVEGPGFDQTIDETILPDSVKFILGERRVNRRNLCPFPILHPSVFLL